MTDKKIRTTIDPDHDVTVNEAELLDLTRAGIVIENDKTNAVKEGK